MPRRPSIRLIACGALCLAVAGCGGGGKPKQRAELRVSLAAVPNKLPGRWDAAVKVTWNNAGSGRRLAVPLPKNGTVEVFTIPGFAVYKISALIEPVDHSSAAGVCNDDRVPVLPKQVVQVTISVDRQGGCTIRRQSGPGSPGP